MENTDTTEKVRSRRLLAARYWTTNTEGNNFSSRERVDTKTGIQTQTPKNADIHTPRYLSISRLLRENKSVQQSRKEPPPFVCQALAFSDLNYSNNNFLWVYELSF
jgi:hypothetical protein